MAKASSLFYVPTWAHAAANAAVMVDLVRGIAVAGAHAAGGLGQCLTQAVPPLLALKR